MYCTATISFTKQKNITMKHLHFLLIAALFITSCTTTNHLHRTGKYVIAEVIDRQPGATTVTLQGITRPLVFLTDTLKIGDTVFVNVLNVRSNKINVTTLKH
jgi:hypothetical protein